MRDQIVEQLNSEIERFNQSQRPAGGWKFETQRNQAQKTNECGNQGEDCCSREEAMG